MAKSALKLGIKSVIICDDIRREDNGKQMLIGIYVGSIEVSSFPINLALAIWIEHKPTAVGETDIEVRFLGPSDAQLFHSSFHAKFHATERSSVGMGSIPLQFQGPGDLRFQVKESGGSWRTYRSIPVRLRDEN